MTYRVLLSHSSSSSSRVLVAGGWWWWMWVCIDYVKHTPEASPVPVLLRRERRAHARAKALETIHDLVRSLSLLSAKQDVLRIAACAWRYDSHHTPHATRLASLAAAPPPLTLTPPSRQID
jgi:hypothetical protein